MELYILDGHTPVPVEDILEWSKWCATAKRHVGDTKVGDIRVSTVFLGINHGWGEGEPILFETMIFGSEKMKDYCERYATWEEAEDGHLRAVRLVKDNA